MRTHSSRNFRLKFSLKVCSLILCLALKGSTSQAETLKFSVFTGYLTQVRCHGRLFLSSVGDPKLIQWEAFPKELGCGVVLKPKGILGSTDLLLKTSTGDVHLILEIKKPAPMVDPKTLELEMGEAETRPEDTKPRDWDTGPKQN